jgi:uncharacterized protein
VPWYWPVDESPPTRRVVPRDEVKLLAPFDPFVWDRVRFELFNDWAYRFEAYTPAPKRVRGYYALPLLWRDVVIGWANLSVRDGALVAEPGYVSGRAPRDPAFRAALDLELSRMGTFLGCGDGVPDAVGTEFPTPRGRSSSTSAAGRSSAG